MKKNRIKAALMIFLLMNLPLQEFPEKISPFNTHIMPEEIAIDSSRFYITEGFSVYIYSLDNFSLITTFGKKGEGPGEFKGRPQLHVRGSSILVNSPSKVSFYTKTGTLIREVNNIISGRNFQPLGNRYVGYYSAMEKDGIRYSGIYMYDSKFSRTKTVYRYQSIAQSVAGKGWQLFSRTYIAPLVCDNKIIVAGDEDFIIEVFDEQGKELYNIKREYQRVKFTREHRDKILNLYKTRPSTAPEYDWWKKNIHFPGYFPAIRSVHASDHKLYVRTYREKENRSEFFVFDLQGKLLKQVFLPIARSSAKNAYPFMQDSTPFTIKNGTLYQLILDEDSEEWILSIEKI